MLWSIVLALLWLVFHYSQNDSQQLSREWVWTWSMVGIWTQLQRSYPTCLWTLGCVCGHSQPLLIKTQFNMWPHCILLLWGMLAGDKWNVLPLKHSSCWLYFCKIKPIWDDVMPPLWLVFHGNKKNTPLSTEFALIFDLKQNCRYIWNSWYKSVKSNTSSFYTFSHNLVKF